MEIRLRSIRFVLMTVLAVGVLYAARQISLARLPVAAPPPPPVVLELTQPPPGAPATGRVRFTDASTIWDWQVACGDALLRWADQYAAPLDTLQVALTDDLPLGPTTVGVGYPAGATPAAIVYAACTGTTDLTCRAVIRQGAPGADLDAAVTAAIPHAIRNAGLLRTPGGAEQIEAIRLNWSWAQFQPLLQEGAESTWRSACLNVSRP